MQELFYIIKTISLPIVLLILLGFFFQKIFCINAKSYSKLLLYIITPIMIFTKLYSAEITWDLFLQVVPFIIILTVVLYSIGLFISLLFKFEKSMRHAFLNSLILFNSGNYGLPLIELAFKNNPYAIVSQLLILLIQNIIGNTVGVFHASTGKASVKQALINVAKMPAIYTIIAVLLIKVFHATIPDFILIPLNYITNAFIFLALTTLGIQLAEVKIGYQLTRVMTATFLRVFIAPLIGFCLILLLGIRGQLAPVLIIGISTPTAVSTAILAKEFDNESDFAAQVVFVTTIFVTFSLPLIIYILRQYY